VSKITSCGVVILNEEGEVLLAHATETTHWDIPKGQGDPGETYADTALRETREETGLQIDPACLVDLGLFSYRHDKNLYLFATRLSRAEADIERCVCVSEFPRRRDGQMIPEMDAFRWVAIRDVDAYASSSLSRLFAQKLSLADLHQRLPQASSTSALDTRSDTAPGTPSRADLLA
jgi:8-oxo-dGTP pyrophosphatase MutT (NUDIX family)